MAETASSTFGQRIIFIQVEEYHVAETYAFILVFPNQFGEQRTQGSTCTYGNGTEFSFTLSVLYLCDDFMVTLDSIFNRVIQNWKKGKTTWIFADEFYLLFRYEYSADFFYRLYKRIRKYSGFVTGLTQNVEELLKSDTARLMLANSEFLILLNQATTDRDELAALLNISDNQLSYITNVGAGHGLIRCSGNLVPFENSFPRNTKLYRLMTTKPGEG